MTDRFSGETFKHYSSNPTSHMRGLQGDAADKGRRVLDFHMGDIWMTCGSLYYRNPSCRFGLQRRPPGPNQHVVFIVT